MHAMLCGLLCINFRIFALSLNLVKRRLTLFNSSVPIAQFPQATSTIDGHNFITSSWRVGQCKTEKKTTVNHTTKHTYHNNA